MTIFSLLVIFFWFIFLIVWLISSLFVKRSIGNLPYYLGIRFLMAFAVFIIFHTGIAKGIDSFNVVQTNNVVIGSIGVVLVAVGIGLAIWARSHLGRNWGQPMTVKEKPELVTTGPYAYIRHPIYTGVLVAIFGSLLVSGPFWIIVFVFAVAFYYFSAKKEEENMLKAFPKTYPAYKDRTKMLIPFLF